jgi:hypothetical protein
MTLALILAIASVAFSAGFACGCLYLAEWRRRELAKRGEEVDPFEFTRRAEAIRLRMSEVRSRAERAKEQNDPATARACVTESELLLDSMRQLRLEQIEVQENGWRRFEPDIPEL